MIAILTPAEMREVDAQAEARLDELIADAGWHVAAAARRMLGGLYGRRITVIAGPGNNGADARVAAEVLTRWGAHVSVVAPEVREIESCSLVIDGAYGTGLNRPYDAPVVAANVPVLAIDCASGIDGLTGELLGNPLPATKTVTFAAHKPGLLLDPGASLAGDVDLVELDLDVSGASSWLIERQDVVAHLPRREPTHHKWNAATMVVGGSPGMSGAPVLAANAALHSGSGLVWCGLPGQPVPSAAHEIVFDALPQQDWHDQVLERAARFQSIVLGPGLGLAKGTADSVHALIEQTTMPLVIDGDALRMLPTGTPLRPNIVLSPHDGEFEALAGTRPGADRFAAVRSVAASLGATVLLKGPLTIVASPDGRCLAVNNGDDRLATAGSGDVLAGVIGSMLTSGLDPLKAAAHAAWLHAAAGNTQSVFGMVASDLLPGLAQILSELASSIKEI